jgi:adenosylmethionine-8-amino-7-oxononanoate aminotransferase
MNTPLADNIVLTALLERIAKFGSPPGAVAATALVGAIAAAVAHSALETETWDWGVLITNILRAGDADTEAYWHTGGTEAWKRYTPMEVSRQASEIFATALTSRGGNRTDFQVARLLALASQAASSLVAERNLRPQTSGRSYAHLLLAGCTFDAIPGLKAVDANRCWIIDESGVEWFDATSGLWNVPLGHGHPAPLGGFLTQAIQVAATNPFSTVTPIAEDVAGQVTSLLGFDGGKCFFCSSGSEAVEVALRFGFASTPANGPVWSLPSAFHGSTAGAAMLSGFPSIRAPLPARSWLGEPCHPRNWTAPGVAFVEALSLSGGLESLTVEMAEQICRFQRAGGIVVADEIASGLGRTTWPVAYHGVRMDPDIVVLGKGLANGVAPLSCVVVSERVANLVAKCGVVDFGHTHSNHPASLGAARETIATLGALDHEKRAIEFSNILTRAGFKHKAAGVSAVLYGNRLVRREEVIDALNSAHVLCHIPTVQHEIRHLILAPPLNISGDELADLEERLHHVLSALGW